MSSNSSDRIADEGYEKCDFVYSTRQVEHRRDIWFLVLDSDGDVVGEGGSDSLICEKIKVTLKPGSYDIFCLTFQKWGVYGEYFLLLPNYA